MAALMAYDYPGNVRELENIVESAIVLCSGNQITPRDLPETVVWGGGGGNEIVVRPGMPLSEVERLCVIETLRYTRGNKQRAAELLGIDPRSIYRKIEQYDISLDRPLKNAS
jgi:DNA-binding NtrC family response regulator